MEYLLAFIAAILFYCSLKILNKITKLGLSDSDRKLKNGKQQLKMAAKGGYKAQALLNNDEKNVYRIIQNVISNTSLHCFSQVSCGEFLTHKSSKKFHSTINSKRVDFCICNKHFKPVAVIEYQGSGHDLSSDSSLRDSVKRLACENAGIKFIEVFPNDDWNKIITKELRSIPSN